MASRQCEECAGKCEDGVELGEYGEDHGLGENIAAVGHFVDTVADKAGLFELKTKVLQIRGQYLRRIEPDPGS